MDNKIHIHIASFAPWSVLPGVGHMLAEIMARKLGFAGLFVVPLRGVTVASLRDAKLPVLFHQEAWNPTTMSNHVFGKPGFSGVPTRFWDPVMFPSPETCMKVTHKLSLNGIKKVVISVNDFRPYDLLEVHAGLNMSLAEIVLWSGFYSKPLVLDLKHISGNMHTGNELPFGEWKTALELLLPFSTLIQVSSHKWDLKSLEILSQQLSFIKELGFCSNVHWMLEFDPLSLGLKNLLNPSNLMNRLAEIKLMTLEALNN